MSYAALRSRYVADAVATASPATLLVMLYDRLVLDLERGEAMLEAGNRGGGNAQVQHAQDILLELRAGLDTEAWEGGPGLAALYVFAHGELVKAVKGADAAAVRGVRELVSPLRDAWREAASAAPQLAATS